MQPHTVLAYRLEHRVGADHVGVQERLGIGQCVVDVGFGREMHDRIRLGDELVHQLCIGDVALHQPNVILDRRQRFPATCVSQRVEHRHRVLAHGDIHEVGADEASAPGDQQPH